MHVTTEPRDGYLLVTAEGAFTLREGMAAYKEAFDVAVGFALDRILIDGLALEGSLSTTERYQFASEVLDLHGASGYRPRVALVGKPPAVDGFGILVLQNRGVDAATFPEIAEALEWLKR